MFWRNGYSKAVRKGDWKLYVNERSGKALLFYLSNDVGETKDLSAAQPEKVKELQKALKEWESQLVKPVWPSGRNELIPEVADLGFYFPI